MTSNVSNRLGHTVRVIARGVSLIFAPAPLMSLTVALAVLIWLTNDFFPIVRMSWSFFLQGLALGCVSALASGSIKLIANFRRGSSVASTNGGPTGGGRVLMHRRRVDPVDQIRWLIFFVFGEELVLRGYLLQALIVVTDGSYLLPFALTVLASTGIGIARSICADQSSGEAEKLESLRSSQSKFNSRVYSNVFHRRIWWSVGVFAVESIFLTVFVLQTRSLFGAMVARFVLELIRLPRVSDKLFSLKGYLLGYRKTRGFHDARI